MNETNRKTKLPVYLVFGAINYTKIKVQEISKFEQPDEPLAELSSFGWVSMSPGKVAELSKLGCTKSFIDDYDVLDVTYIVRDDISARQDFKDQLERSKDGWYKTELM